MLYFEGVGKVPSPPVRRFSPEWCEFSVGAKQVGVAGQAGNLETESATEVRNVRCTGDMARGK